MTRLFLCLWLHSNQEQETKYASGNDLASCDCLPSGNPTSTPLVQGLDGKATSGIRHSHKCTLYTFTCVSTNTPQTHIHTCTHHSRSTRNTCTCIHMYIHIPHTYTHAHTHTRTPGDRSHRSTIISTQPSLSLSLSALKRYSLVAP